MTDTTCPRCGGINGNHGLVHVRFGNGGGYNKPCPDAEARETAQDAIEGLDGGDYDDVARYVLDALRDSGFQLVELPERDTTNTLWFTSAGTVRTTLHDSVITLDAQLWMTADDARELAAALLAAAKTVEEGQR